MPTLGQSVLVSLQAGLSVGLAYACVVWTGLPDQLSATFAALACVSPTVVTGLRRGFEQLVASALGGVITVLLLLWLPRNPLALGAAIAFTIFTAYRVGFARAFLVSGFTVLYLVVLPAATPRLALEIRLASLAIGIGSATAVNALVGALGFRIFFPQRVRAICASLRDGYAQLLEEARGRCARGAAAATFEAAAAQLAVLGAELADARRELLLRRSRQRDLSSFDEQVRALVRLAYHGQELCRSVSQSRIHPTTLLPVIEAIRAAACGNADPTEPQGSEEWLLEAKRALAAARQVSGLPGLASSE